MFAGCASPPTRQRRIATKKCEYVPCGEKSSAARSSTSQAQLPCNIVVRVSRTALFCLCLCKHIVEVHSKYVSMSSLRYQRSTPLGLLSLFGKQGELIALWQVAVAVGELHGLVAWGPRLANDCGHNPRGMRRGREQAGRCLRRSKELVTQPRPWQSVRKCLV